MQEVSREWGQRAEMPVENKVRERGSRIGQVTASDCSAQIAHWGNPTLGRNGQAGLPPPHSVTGWGLPGKSTAEAPKLNQILKAL